MHSSYQFQFPAMSIESLQPKHERPLQAGVISSEITMLNGFDSGILFMSPNSCDWRYRIKQVTLWVIPVTWRSLPLETKLSQQ